MAKCIIVIGALIAFSCAGCWMTQSILDEDAAEQFGDGGTSTDDSEYAYVNCSDLAPCVVSDVSGYTCPGSPTGVKCWNLGNKCSVSYLCATTSQACSIVCNQTTCGESTATPPKPICN